MTMLLITNAGEKKSKEDFARETDGEILEKGKPATPAGGKTPKGYTVKIVGGKRTYVKEAPKKKAAPKAKKAAKAGKDLTPGDIDKIPVGGVIRHKGVTEGHFLTATRISDTTWSVAGIFNDKSVTMAHSSIRGKPGDIPWHTIEGKKPASAKPSGPPTISGNPKPPVSAVTMNDRDRLEMNNNLAYKKPVGTGHLVEATPFAIQGAVKDGFDVWTLKEGKGEEGYMIGTYYVERSAAAQAVPVKPSPAEATLSGGVHPGLAKDKKDFAQMLKDLKTIQGGGKVENLSEEGAKSTIKGLSQAIANKYKIMIDALKKETGGQTTGTVMGMMEDRDKVLADAKAALESKPAKKSKVTENVTEGGGGSHGPKFGVGDTLKLGNSVFIVKGISRSTASKEGDVRYHVDLRKPKGKTFIYGVLYDNGIWSSLTRMGKGMPHQVLSSGYKHEVVEKVHGVKKEPATELPGLEKAMSGIDALDDYLEKARGKTPEGGKTPKGYTVKIVGGKRTYVKEEPGEKKKDADWYEKEVAEENKKFKSILTDMHAAAREANAVENDASTANDYAKAAQLYLKAAVIARKAGRIAQTKQNKMTSKRVIEELNDRAKAAKEKAQKMSAKKEPWMTVTGKQLETMQGESKAKKSMPADLNAFLEKAEPATAEEEEKQEIEKEKKRDVKPPTLPATKKGKKMNKAKELTPAKARKILHDKEVHGHPLTDKQRKFMGAVASGTARKSLILPFILEGDILEEPLEKSLLAKGYFSLKRIDEWTGQFWDDDALRLEALRCMKESVKLDKERDEFQKTKKTWREMDDMSRAQREKLRDQYRKKEDEFNKRDEAISVKMRALEVKLLDHRIKEAEIRSKARAAKSMTEGIETLDRYTLQKSLTYGIHFSKSEPKSESEGIMELDEYLEKAQSMPTGGPREALGSGEEQGGKVAGKGKTGGTSDSAAGPGQDSRGQVKGAPASKKQKLSDDDDDDEEKQMKPGKKPIERTTKSAFPADQRDMVAHENAQVVSRLRKGDEAVPVNIPAADLPENPEEAAEPVQKSKIGLQGPDSLVVYSTAADDAVDRLQKSQEKSLYSSESPQVTPSSLLVNQQVKCRNCERLMAKSLSACPHCGAGCLKHQPAPVVTDLEKSDVTVTQQSRPGLLRPPKREPDLFLPNGVQNDESE